MTDPQTDRMAAYRDDTGQLTSYAWPGGYPMFYLADDGEVFCPSCANQNDAEPPIVAGDANWEDPELFCDGCSARIPSAYAEPEDDAAPAFRSQAARDAQAAGYGDEGYWRYLDETALRHQAYFLAHGDPDRAAELLTESLSAALAGNDGA